MGIIGKVIGGSLGYALGGPIGAFAGAAFGHVYDCSTPLASQCDEPRTIFQVEKSQLSYLVNLFSMLAKIAGVDGRISNQEIDTVQSFAVKELQLSSRDSEIAFNIFYAASNSPASFESFALRFQNQFGDQPEIIDSTIDIFWRVSLCDGMLTSSEESLLCIAARIFAIDRYRFEQIKARHVSPSDIYYRILGVSRESTDGVVKKHYRFLVQAYHPDKLGSQDLSDACKALAQEKFREIQNAFEIIKKERKMK